MSQRSLGGEPGVAFPQLPRDSGRRGNAWERHRTATVAMSFTCSTLLRCECRGHASCAFDLDFAPQGARLLPDLSGINRSASLPYIIQGVIALRADFDLVFCPGILSRVCSLSGLSSASSSPDLLVAVRG